MRGRAGARGIFPLLGEFPRLCPARNGRGNPCQDFSSVRDASVFLRELEVNFGGTIFDVLALSGGFSESDESAALTWSSAEDLLDLVFLFSSVLETIAEDLVLLLFASLVIVVLGFFDPLRLLLFFLCIFESDEIRIISCNCSCSCIQELLCSTTCSS